MAVPTPTLRPAQAHGGLADRAPLPALLAKPPGPRDERKRPGELLPAALRHEDERKAHSALQIKSSG